MVRTHLGVETQRQWSDLAIARTTPALLGLFSWTTLAAGCRHPMKRIEMALNSAGVGRFLTGTPDTPGALYQTCRFPCLRRS